MCWVRKVEKFAFFHIFADIAIAIGLTVLTVYGVKEVVKNGISTDTEVLNHKTYLTAIGLAAYTFEGIGIIIPIMETTTRPDLYPKILSGVVILVTFIYLFFGNLMYFSFGKERVGEEPLITEIMPTKDIPIALVDVIWIINLLITFPLVLHPASMVIESYIFGKMKKGIPRKWLKNFSRTICVGFVVALSVTLLSTMDKLESVNGSFACIPLAFLLPSIFHYKLVAKTKFEKIIDLAVAAFSFGLMISCSVITLIYWND